MSYYIALTGNPGDGFVALGPFADADGPSYELSDNDEWWSLELVLPGRDPWECDLIQFARLIAELEAAGAFTPQVINDLCASMDLISDRVAELMDRAQATWDEMKETV